MCNIKYDIMSEVVSIWIDIEKAKQAGCIVRSKGGRQGLVCTIAKRRSGNDNYGNTHSVYKYNKGADNVYIGTGKQLTFEDAASDAIKNGGDDDIPF